MKVTLSKADVPLGAALTCKLANVNFEWGNETNLPLSSSVSLTSSHSISRHVARMLPKLELYPSNILHRTEVDHWLSLSSGPLGCNGNILNVLAQLNKSLAPSSFLTSDKLTIADLELFGVLYKSKAWNEETQRSSPHVFRWFNYIKAKVDPALSSFSGDVLPSLCGKNEEQGSLTRREDGGKFVELPDAVMGEVVVRFPPEASGYLHIGHAKAALLNQYYQQAFKGKLIMRFDDTNPDKEKADFEHVILEDLKLLDLKPDVFSFTSNYFGKMLEMCEDLLKRGLAYVDDTDGETMKKEREAKVESKNRSNSPEKNLKMWEEMKKGTPFGQQCCVRAKIDMSSPNGCMRDPTIYRCKNEPHPRTGDTYKVYPTYDFACPIVDSVEGVTHALRTTEYHDRDEQFFWFLEKLNLRKLHIYEYSRLNMTNTVLSKRKLTWFVNEGLVDGWDDPRFPTVRGIIRQGMTVEGLKEFIVAQGSSRSVVNMEWDKIWSFNKKVIDRDATRFTALEGDLVPVFVRDAKEESKEAPKHPKDPAKGTKTVWVGPKVFIEAVDADILKEGENATFINWGNLKILKVHRNGDSIERVDAELNLSNTDFKKTPKLTWLPETSQAPFTPVVCHYFSHLISKSVLAKDEDFKNFVNPCTRRDLKMIGEHDLKLLKEGDIIQLQRKGFFRVDEAYKPFSAASCKEGPLVLFYVPDGHTKDSKLSAKEAKQSAKGKQGEKSPQEEKSPANIPGTETPLEIHQKIKTQGDKIRKLKSDKADKSIIMPEVEVLKGLKVRFKDRTGSDWTPDIDPSTFDKAATTNAKSTTSETKTNSTSSSNEAMNIHNQIKAQGDKVRILKGQGADKTTIKNEVNGLLELKKQFKVMTNIDWKPDIDVNSFGPPAVSKTNQSTSSATELSSKINTQGDKIRSLKASQADKETIKAEVGVLLNLKNEFKTITGTEWKPDVPVAQKMPAAAAKTSGAGSPIVKIHNQIKTQGDKVRSLKAAKADKDSIKKEVDELLALKAEFKKGSGLDWKPDIDVSSLTSSCSEETSKTSKGSSNALQIHNLIKVQGDKVRALKTQKADKETITTEVNVLLNLKKDFKELTNIDWKPDIDPSSFSERSKAAPLKRDKPQESKKSPAKEVKRPKTEASSSGKKVTRLGIESMKEENLSEWYSQVITKAEMIEYYNVSGCYILRPWSYRIWELVKDFFDGEIKKLGIENAYFPIFVSKDALEREKAHISDFSPEVAWVTRSGSSDMAEPVAIRPTSETVMYPAFAKWIQSHRDLPIRLNQWNNVVRWEFKQPTPFLRTREFLWQEGHSAFVTKEEACEEVYAILELYARIYEELLAIPVVRGHKTEKEKFAGGDFTTTTEAYISASGRAIQGATSHHLGQNFSKMFEIVFEDPKTQEKKYVFQNSWGITTRTIGVMVMVHGDNKGLVLPPRVAPIQVVIMPVGITVGTTDEVREALVAYCTGVEQELKEKGIRVRCDLKDNVTPAWKFNHWELKGVPIRVEVGPRELEANRVFAVRRDNGSKESLERVFIDRRIYNLLEMIHQDMYDKAKEDLDTHKVNVRDWAEFIKNLDLGNIMVAPFCGVEECEDAIKKDSAKDEPSEAGAPSMGAKALCIPYEQPGKVDGLKCIYPSCSRSPKFFTLFGRSY